MSKPKLVARTEVNYHDVKKVEIISGRTSPIGDSWWDFIDIKMYDDSDEHHWDGTAFSIRIYGPKHSILEIVTTKDEKLESAP